MMGRMALQAVYIGLLGVCWWTSALPAYALPTCEDVCTDVSTSCEMYCEDANYNFTDCGTVTSGNCGKPYTNADLEALNDDALAYGAYESVEGASLMVEEAYEVGLIDDGSDYVTGETNFQGISCSAKSEKLRQFNRLIGGLNKVAALYAGGAVVSCLIPGGQVACAVFGLASAGSWYLGAQVGDLQQILTDTPCQ